MSQFGTITINVDKKKNDFKDSLDLYINNKFILLLKFQIKINIMDRIICLKSSKTGRSVEYSFTEFEDEETERIAAKTLNNYILFEKILK